MFAPTTNTGSASTLLQPTIGTEPQLPSLYSTRATFWVAFFGGPYAAVLFAALVEHHLGKLRRTLGVFLLAFAAAVTFQYFCQPLRLADFGVEASDVRRVQRYATRGFGLLLWALFHARHRRYFQMAEMQGLPTRKAWRDGLLTVLAATVLVFVVAAIVREE